MSDSWYYDFIHPDHAVRMALLKNVPYVQLRYLNDIVGTKISMFKYENLPDNLTSNILELALTFRHNLCFYYISALDKWTLCAWVSNSQFNEYYRPTNVSLFALNGEHLLDSVPYEDLILVRDNPMDIPPFLTIMEYLNKITELENDMMVLCDHASLPLVLKGNKRQATALKQQAKAFGHKNSFIVTDEMGSETLESYDIKLSINPLDIYDLKKKYLNECMSSIGIYSVEEKRERIVTQELVNQNDYTDFIYNKQLNERKRFVSELNKISGLNVKLIESYEETFMQGVEENAISAESILYAKGKAIKRLDPDADFSGSNPVKLTAGGKK